MPEKFEGTTLPQESLEDLKSQEKRALEEHEQLRQASENDPKDSELRVAVDKAYDKWQEAKRKVAKFEESE
ncbi:MAG: hypothetical protein ABH884_01305 [Candidatus Komeilibacteria bacterium]